MWSISQTYPSATSPPPALQRSPAIALLIALRELFAGSRGPQSCLAPPGSNFQRPLVDTRPGVAPDLDSFIARLYIRESNPVGPTQLFETPKEVVLWSQKTDEKQSGARGLSVVWLGKKVGRIQVWVGPRFVRFWSLPLKLAHSCSGSWYRRSAN